jgi:hypothetical protein
LTLQPSGYVSYLPGNTTPSYTRKIGESLYVIVKKLSRDFASMALVDAECDVGNMEGHVLAIRDHPNIHLDMLLDNGSEPAPIFGNRWILCWARSYNLRIGEDYVFQLVNERQQAIRVLTAP